MYPWFKGTPEFSCESRMLPTRKFNLSLSNLFGTSNSHMRNGRGDWEKVTVLNNNYQTRIVPCCSQTPPISTAKEFYEKFTVNKY